MMDGKTLIEIQDTAGWATNLPTVAKSVMQLCGYIAELEKELADAQARIVSLEDALANLRMRWRKGKIMMYYTVNAEDGRIIDGPDFECPKPQEQANYFGCPIYIIIGEHSGLTAEPEPVIDGQILS